MKLSTYAEAGRTSAMKNPDYWVRDYRAYYTGKERLAAIKIAIRTRAKQDEYGSDANLSLDPAVQQEVKKNLEDRGFTVVKIRNSWFDYGRGGMGADAVTFYVKQIDEAVSN